MQEYEVNGATFLMSEEEAERRGATPVKAATVETKQQKAPQNKAIADPKVK